MQDRNTVFRITKWDRTFETADSRRHERLFWVSVPIGFQSNGYAMLIEEFEDDSPAMYGAWIAMVLVAASCTVRGLLCTSSGIGYTTRRLSLHSHFPKAIFDRLIDWAVRDDVHWIEVVPPEEVRFLLDQSRNDCEPVEDQPPNDIPNLTKPNLTKHNHTQPNHGSGGESLVVVKDFSFDFDQLATKAKAFKKMSTRSTLTAQVCLLVVAYSQLDGRGFATELAENLRSESIRSVTKYVKGAMRNSCQAHGWNYDETVNAIEQKLKMASDQRKLKT